MRLLFITQAVDRTHSNLALAHRWIEAFAGTCAQVSVICLFEGAHALPENVRVYSLGKERGKRSAFVYALRFLGLMWRLRKEHEAVLVHMNPEYVVLGGLFWRVWGKKIALWYTHKSVNLKLRLAVLLAHRVFTASRESFRLATIKVRVMGHGIDTELFAFRPKPAGALRIVTAGRISSAKRLIEMFAALDVLYARGIPFEFGVAGASLTRADAEYEHTLRNEAAARPYAESLRFAGPVPYEELPEFLAAYAVFLNLSETGSLDRAVLEAMAVGLVPVSSNDAFRAILEPYGLFVSGALPEALADALVAAQAREGAEFSRLVEREHSLHRLIPALTEQLERL